MEEVENKKKQTKRLGNNYVFFEPCEKRGILLILQQFVLLLGKNKY